MNPEAEALLRKILAKELHELTQEDKDFLIARKMYIGKSSREKFAEIFQGKKKVVPQSKVAAPVEKMPEEVKTEEPVTEDEEDEEIDDLL